MKTLVFPHETREWPPSIREQRAYAAETVELTSYMEQEAVAVMIDILFHGAAINTDAGRRVLETAMFWAIEAEAAKARQAALTRFLGVIASAGSVS